MQRMLIGLVLFLTAAVGGLGIAVYNLADDRGSNRASGGGTRQVTTPEIDPARVEALESRVTGLRTEVRDLQTANRRLAGELAAARALKGGPARDPTPPPPVDPGAPRESPLKGTDPGAITEADVAYFVAVQKRVERRRRIDGQTRNMMRRIDRMVTKSEIQPVDENRKADVEKIMRRFVTAQDDLITAYVREPSPEIRALSAEARRDERAAAAGRIGEEARVALEEVLGATDADKIAERTLASLVGRRNLPGRASGYRPNR